MITLEQKLSQFHAMVEDKINRDMDLQIRAKSQEVEDFIRKETLKIEGELREVKKSALQRIDRQKQEKISMLIQKERKEYLRHSETCLGKLMEKVKDQCYDFVKGEDYIPCVCGLLERTLQNEEHLGKETAFEIFLNPRRFEEVRAELQAILEEKGFQNAVISRGSLTTIGGFVLEAESEHIRITKTLASAIEMKRKEIGQFLSDYIREGGTA